jgi:hypothetical protein
LVLAGCASEQRFENVVVSFKDKNITLTNISVSGEGVSIDSNYSDILPKEEQRVMSESEAEQFCSETGRKLCIGNGSEACKVRVPVEECAGPTENEDGSVTTKSCTTPALEADGLKHIGMAEDEICCFECK